VSDQPVLDLEAITEKWLQVCGPCDAGLAGHCAHPDEDYRPAMLSLVREVERLRNDVVARDLLNQVLSEQADQARVAEVSRLRTELANVRDKFREANDRHEAARDALRAQVAEHEQLRVAVYLAGTGFRWRRPDGETVLLNPSEVDVFLPADQAEEHGATGWSVANSDSLFARVVAEAQKLVAWYRKTAGSPNAPDPTNPLRPLADAVDALPSTPRAPRSWSLPLEPAEDVTAVVDRFGQRFERGTAHNDDGTTGEVWVGTVFTGGEDDEWYDVPELQLTWDALMRNHSPLNEAAAPSTPREETTP
jgi:hypothetical protein